MPAVHFYIPKETKAKVEELKVYAKEVGDSFRYELFFTLWVDVSAELLLSGRADHLTFESLADYCRAHYAQHWPDLGDLKQTEVLLATFHEKDEATNALMKIEGNDARLDIRRENGGLLCKLYGNPTWWNLEVLELYNLPLLQEIVIKKRAGEDYDTERHQEIITRLEKAALSLGLVVPEEWR